MVSQRNSLLLCVGEAEGLAESERRRGSWARQLGWTKPERGVHLRAEHSNCRPPSSAASGAIHCWRQRVELGTALARSGTGNPVYVHMRHAGGGASLKAMRTRRHLCWKNPAGSSVLEERGSEVARCWDVWSPNPRLEAGETPRAIRGDWHLDHEHAAGCLSAARAHGHWLHCVGWGPGAGCGARVSDGKGARGGTRPRCPGWVLHGIRHDCLPPLPCSAFQLHGPFLPPHQAGLSFP